MKCSLADVGAKLGPFLCALTCRKKKNNTQPVSSCHPSLRIKNKTNKKQKQKKNMVDN